MSENPPNGQPGAVWHRVEVVTTHPYGEPLRRTVEGDDTWVAASLRALADKLDPPKPPRPMRAADTLAGGGNLVRRGPGGAGLVSMSIPPSSGTAHVDPMSTR